MKQLCIVDGCNKHRVGQGLCDMHYARKRRNGHVGQADRLRILSPHGTAMAWLEAHRNYQGQDCLKWPFSVNDKGRGLLLFRGRTTQAPRAMCILAHGDPPSPNHFSAHNCGKGHEGCVHPGHLRWATQKENLADMVVHGTILRGEKNPAHKLTPDEVAEIRRRLKTQSAGITAIAKEFCVGRTAIRRIKHGETWAWME
jgi:hypothetical protein